MRVGGRAPIRKDQTKPITITLSTIPGTLTRERGYTSKTIELFGPSLGTVTLSSLSTVADIKAAVALFGTRMRVGHPDASFTISVRLARGNRKPNGYDAASNGNGFGQDDFLHVEDGRARATTPAPTLATASPGATS